MPLVFVEHVYTAFEVAAKTPLSDLFAERGRPEISNLNMPFLLDFVN